MASKMRRARDQQNDASPEVRRRRADGLVGAGEELTDAQIDHQIATHSLGQAAGEVDPALGLRRPDDIFEDALRHRLYES